MRQGWDDFDDIVVMNGKMEKKGGDWMRCNQFEG